MRALRVSDSGPSSVYLDEQAVQPKPGAGEVVIRVAAAGITPTELAWYPTRHKKTGEPRVGAIPGHEFSGLIADVGEGVGHLGVGHAVFGMNDWFSDGAMAEFCVAPYFAIAPKPSSLNFAQAASVPISALTAWQALFDRAKLRRGENILIHGGGGAVGSFALQLAHLFGAHVTTTASARDHDYVSRFRPSRIIDYQRSKFEDVARDMDVVFDTVGGDTLSRSWSVLKPGGRMVTIVSSEADSADPRAKQALFVVEAKENELVEIARLLDAGKLHAILDSVVPLADVRDVYSGKIHRKGNGKIVASVSDIYA